ncbi:MAG: hypothetical protein C4340_06820, partial [Armatimonadota bacterium]
MDLQSVASKPTVAPVASVVFESLFLLRAIVYLIRANIYLKRRSSKDAWVGAPNVRFRLASLCSRGWAAPPSHSYPVATATCANIGKVTTSASR